MFTLVACALVFGAGASSSGTATVKLPPLSQLTRAVAAGDDVEIERVAARFGPIKLQRIAETGQKSEKLAALRALTLVEGGWNELPDVARLLAESDADVADAAARTVRQIAAGLTPETMWNAEVPRDVPARAAASLLEAARRTELRAPLRVAAVSAAASLRAVTRLDESVLLRLLSDGDAPLRRAVAESLTGVAAAEAPLTHALESDPAAEVSAAAGAVLCRDVPAVGDKGPAVERAARLGPAARDRLRKLAADDEIALVDRLDLLGCLRVHAQPPDQKVLDQLAHAKLEPLKRRARSLGGR
jgi:hypothetical protein